MSSKPRYQPGDKIGGRFQVHKAIRGGMGEVYLCLDLTTSHPFALKTFQQRYLTSPDMQTLFKEEVATWVALGKHPNIVRCFLMDTFDNQPFILLEWVAGSANLGVDLRNWLRNGPLALQLTLDFTIDICRGLHHAQTQTPGLVHRDLKPNNILVTQDQIAKITDFGLAAVVQRADMTLPDIAEDSGGRQRLVKRGEVVGTPPYMAPEQWRGEPVDSRTDLYAIGCILYELLTGHWLFAARTSADFRHHHLHTAIPKLAEQLQGTLSTAMLHDLDALLARCLAKRREERFVHINALLAALIDIYRSHLGALPRAITVDENLTPADYNNRGYTYGELRRYPEALADYARALDLKLDYASAYVNRGNVYADLHRYAEALADYDHALALDPTLATVYNNRGNTYADVAQVEQALADYTHALALDPGFALAYNNRGRVYQALQRDAEALGDYARALALNPDLTLVYVNRGELYAGLQRYTEALADYTRALVLDPTLATVYYNRGAIYQALGHDAEALADYTHAVELDAGLTAAYVNRGAIHQAMQQYEQAAADYTRALALDPTLALAYNNRGVTYQVLQRDEEALADYAHAIELDPTLATAYTNAGRMLGNQGRLHEALSYFKQAAHLGDPVAAQYAAQVQQMLGTSPT